MRMRASAYAHVRGHQTGSVFLSFVLRILAALFDNVSGLPDITHFVHALEQKLGLKARGEALALLEELYDLSEAPS